MSSATSPDTDIAIVGMAGRFPGARTVESFWKNLCSGVESIVPLSDGDLRRAGLSDEVIGDPNYVKSAAPLDDVDRFDAGFFGFSPRDASILDPQHRHFFECVWEALEDAGHVPEGFGGAIGVFAGCGMNAYFSYHLLPNLDLMRSAGLFLVRHTGNDKDFLTTRASYLFNLTGPSVGVQTACSTSLVAVHLACEHLLNFQCDLALAGGVTIELPHRIGYRFEEGEILSPDGHCRAFDANARGTVFGSGVGVVALRRLADALADRDHVYAVIKGSAVNNDGAGKVGYLAPSVEGQARAVAEALSVAMVAPDSIGYVEAHGTGTPIGDPIEIAALTQAFRERSCAATGFCAVGSVKTNIGHLDTAAGVASLIKAALAVERGLIPASLHYANPNPAIDLSGTPFFVCDRSMAWPASQRPRRAGVNSLGVGGTNAHVVLEEPPASAESAGAATAAPDGDDWCVVPLSARSDASLSAVSRRLAKALDSSNPALRDVAYTMQVGRRRFAHRRAVVGHSTGEVAQALAQLSPASVITGHASDTPAVAFLFPGGGAQYPDMGATLHARERVYRHAFDQAHEAAVGLGLPDVRSAILAPLDAAQAAHTLARPLRSTLSLFLVEYALAELWRSKGVEPTALLGHSLGEYVAAHLAGVFSLEDALRIVGARGDIFERLPPGAMLSVVANPDIVGPLLGPRTAIAAVNAPDVCVVSGPTDELDVLATSVRARGWDVQRLHISVAAHSPLLDPWLDEFRARISRIAYAPPRRALISNVTGTWATEEVAGPDYWVRHLRHRVLFADGLATLLDTHRAVALLEVGPGSTLSSLARQHPARGTEQVPISSMRHAQERVPDGRVFATAVATLWTRGVDVAWPAFHRGNERRVPLPTYAWDHHRYWIDAPPPAFISGHERVRAGTAHVEWLWERQWLPVDAPTASSGQPAFAFDDMLLVSGHEDEAERALIQAGRQRGARVITHYHDANAERPEPRASLASDPLARWQQRLQSLRDPRRRRLLVVYLLALEPISRKAPLGVSSSPTAAAADLQRRAFDELLHLAQALAADESEDTSVRLLIVTRGAQPVEGLATSPLSALVTGPALALMAESPGVGVSHLDVAPDAALDIDELLRLASAAEFRPEVSLRGGGWFAPAVVKRVPPSPTATCLRHGGVYWLTGGLGGVSMAVARRLARDYQARLLLTGRTVLPPRHEWPAVVEQQPEGDAVATHLEDLLELERLGGTVDYEVADLGDAAAVETVVRTTTARWGAIHGIFHTAGTVDDGPLLTKTLASAHAVLRPKVSGTLHICAAIAQTPPDFLVLFSSTSSILGLEGQVDYMSAAAFLDAVALSPVCPCPTLSIGWGIWKETGMVARALDAHHVSSHAAAMPRASTPRHPLLGRCVSRTERQVVFEAPLSAKNWELREHRLASGDAVLPGVAYLDALWAAVRFIEHTDRVDLLDVDLLLPLSVANHAVRVLRTTLQRDDDGWRCRIDSQAIDDGGNAWLEHATARARTHTEPRGTRDAAAMWTDAVVDSRAFDANGLNPKQHEHVRFGPRWMAVRRPRQGDRTMAADIVLDGEFAADLAVGRLHPALLDVATALALPTIDGYGASTDLYAPVRWRGVRVHAPLPSRCLARAIARPDSSAAAETASFDVTVCDAAGRLLVEIDDFVMRRLHPTRLLTSATDATAATGPALDRLRRWFRHGIATEAGVDLLMALVDGSTRGHVFVTPLDLPAQIDDVRSARPARGGSFTEGRTDEGWTQLSPTERAVAAVWQHLLNTPSIGKQDDFFLLGGHSLLAVRSIARIERATGVRLDLATLFEHRTLDSVAALIDGRRAAEPPATSAGPTARQGPKAVDRSAYRVDRSRLIPETDRD